MAGLTLLLRDVEVRGWRVDVRLDGDRVAAVGAGLDATGADDVVDGHGGALIPGLHDHHLHLAAMAAARLSIDCGLDIETRLRTADAARPTGEWLRGTGYHESVAGPLDRWTLDAWVPTRPVRVQHRSGALWILNSAALQAIGESGDGRLFRRDLDLRDRIPPAPVDLAGVGADLTAYGITGVTDATPELTPSALGLLATHAPDLPRVVHLLGARDDAKLPDGWSTGPWKILLHDHDLPPFDELCERISAAHGLGRAVAVHCVTRESLLLTVTALETVGIRPADRIEHAAVVPHEILGRLRDLRVVTQPGFLRLRGDDYRRDVAPDDLPLLYPYQGLCSAGIRVAPSSDAPYGEVDPWQVMSDAAQRISASGAVLGAEERVAVSTVLDGYLSAPEDPGGRPRQITVGSHNLVLLREPLAEVLRHPHRDLVDRTFT